MPPSRDVVEGRVYLDYNNTIEPLVYTSVWATFPTDHVAATILKMQKEGFWAPRPQKGEMVFIPAGRILQVQLYDKDKIRDEKP